MGDLHELLGVAVESYGLQFKFIFKEDPEKIVLKLWLVDQDGARLTDDSYHDLIWWEENILHHANGISFKIPPTRMKLKEKLLWWIVLAALGWSVILHVVR